jgi:hypothetical protein
VHYASTSQIQALKSYNPALECASKAFFSLLKQLFRGDSCCSGDSTPKTISDSSANESTSETPSVPPFKLPPFEFYIEWMKHTEIFAILVGEL